ncbi:MAG TPA: hypothetical protein VF136_14105 [Methylomirabilota bacterium]
MVVTTELAVHRSVGQDVIDDPQEGVRQGDHSLLGAAMAQHPSETGLQGALLARLAPAAASIRAVRSPRFPFRVVPDSCLPALALFPGQRAAQLARCAALGQALMSTPTSAMITSAVRRLMPGMLSSRVSWSAKGARRLSISVLRVAMASSM